MSSNLIPVIVRHWQKRKAFAGTMDWVTYLYNRLLRRLPKWPLPGRQATVKVRLHGQPDPFYIRLGTTDLLVLEEMFGTGEYAFVKNALPDVRTIVDLGANVGFSLRYWQGIFPGASIIAVEPDPKNFRLCQQNIELAHFSRQVTLIQACVGAHRRQVRLQGAEEWGYRMVEGSSPGGIMTDVLPLAEILETHAPNQTIDLLKCDIEGAEQELFGECAPWISRVRAIVIELHSPYSTADFFADLKNSGVAFQVVKIFAEKQNPVILLQAAPASVPRNDSACITAK